MAEAPEPPASGAGPVTTGTRRLLWCGVLAGPLFTLAWLLEGATRPDYDSLRHPVSSLSIGEQGWMQAVVFLLTGLLTLAFAAGLRRVLPEGSSPWAYRLIAVAGVGLIGAGFFVTDPMNGYPPGTALVPVDYTLSGRLHRLFSALFFLGLPLACFVWTRLFRRWGNGAWTAFSALSGSAFLATFVLTSAAFLQAGGLGPYAGALQRLSLTIGWLWLTLLALHLRRRG